MLLYDLNNMYVESPCEDPTFSLQVYERAPKLLFTSVALKV